ncbi:MAG TPA: response regulator transcription factor [Syntrophorhabdales bacterium]|nr:response regulator transcription factor [Syntrophorhabdales bacterium]
MTDNRSPFTGVRPTVFVVDDDASVRKSLSRLLDSLGLITETYASADEFLKREHYGGVGCIVLDVRMPGLSGMDLQDELSKADYSMPIIFISGHGNIPMSVRAMKKGAVDFLPKPFDEQELIDALKKAIEKDRTAKAERTEARDIQTRIEQLTPREYEIFRYVITGMLNKQIAFKLDIAEKTVKIHRARVFEKLCANSVAELVRMAEKAGVEPPD